MVQDIKLTKEDAQDEAGQTDALRAPSPESSSWSRQLIVALRLLIAGLLLCSVLYPAFVTLVSKTLWATDAHGRIVELDGAAVGAELIGQSFNSDIFFHPRPSSKGYNGMNSGSQNLGPLNEVLTEVVGPGREWVFNRFLFGHNADQLANRAPCSVLMYRAKGRKLNGWCLGSLKAIGQRVAPDHGSLL